MNNALVSNWNKVVAPNDIVFHLGDFCFGDRKTWKSFCSKLNGTKYLIQGNHDRENEIYYEGFDLVWIADRRILSIITDRPFNLSSERSLDKINISKHSLKSNEYRFNKYPG